jgi:membrane-associated phospholipid phosphatase
VVNNLKQSQYFIFIQAIFVIIITVFLLNYSKSDAQILANSYYSTFFDYLFYILTHSVEFWGCLFIYVLVAIFKSYKYAIIGILTYATSGLVAQLLKRNVFADFKRPTANIDNLRLIPEFFELKQNTAFSFPSGHTTVAFTLFLFLTLIVKNKKWGLLFGVLASLIAYSRVYLSQHYFIDILAGSIIGLAVTSISFYLFDKINFGKWADKRILTKKSN